MMAGCAQFSDPLSQQLAQRLCDDLIRRGIPTDRIEVSSRGKRDPLVPTAEGVSEARNRRVAIGAR